LTFRPLLEAFIRRSRY